MDFDTDANGYLTNDGTNTYIWDRAGRLLSMGGHSYAYDGNGVRISQTINSIVTSYLNDTQPGLPVVLAQTTGGSTDRFVHLPGQGILAQQDNAGDWTWPISDGLRSVRSVVNDDLSVGSVESYAPFGTPLEPGSFGSPFMFTGEPLDANGLLYLRARYYIPDLGVFMGLDPVENLNRYQYAGANPTNRTDPSGLCPLLNEDSLLQRADAEQCHQLARTLRQWGVIVVWDSTAVDPYWARQNCLPEKVVAACNPQGRQRWTTNEMRAVFNAFKIFESAHQNLGMGSVYQWPLANPVYYRKSDYVGTSVADLAALGKHEYATRTITMSARNWGEFENADYTVNAQIRAWLALHEFSHIFVKDRKPPDLDPQWYAEETLPNAIVNRFGRVVPTAYATFTDQERAIEVVTATLWNNGYTVVGFSSGAGGRTAPIGEMAQDSYNLTWTLTNVRDIAAQGETLEQWIITNVILRNP